jgi:electron transfer flavoprotein beta subunit
MAFMEYSMQRWYQNGAAVSLSASAFWTAALTVCLSACSNETAAVQAFLKCCVPRCHENLEIGPFDLILAGERATDGETGQVGPSVGSLLGVSVLTYVSKLEAQNGKLKVERAVEGGHESVLSPMPALAVVIKEINVPRLCTLSGKIRGKKAEIRTFSSADLGLAKESVGLAGSPTKVVKVDYPRVTRKGRKISASEDFDEAVKELTRFLSEMKAEGV